MTKPINTASIEKSTGRAWSEWCEELDAAGARRRSHRGIAELVQESHGLSGWWAQSIAVAYEQHIGRRQPGQGNDGHFTASLSRLLPAPPEAVFAAWMEIAADRDAFFGRHLARPAATSRTPKRLYWRCRFADGTRLVLAIEPKPGGKSLAAIEHQRLPSAAALKRVKAEWGEMLGDLSEEIARR